MSLKDCRPRPTTAGIQCRCGAPAYPHGSEAERLEQEFWAIKRQSEGRPIKTLRAMPEVVRVLRSLFTALVSEARRGK